MFPVTFAGFAFSGDAANIYAAFPITQRIQSQKNHENQSPVDAAVFDLFRKKGDLLPNARLNYNELASSSQSAVVMAVAMTGESFSSENLSDVYKNLFVLGLQVVFLDFEEMRVLASYPIRIQYTDATRTPPSDQYAESVVRKLLTDQEFGLIKSLQDRLPALRVVRKNGLALKVAQVNVEDYARTNMPARYSLSLDSYTDQLAQQLGDQLTHRLGVSMLPFSKDSATAHMALRFAGTRTLMFKIPQPAFAVDFTIRDLVRKVASETPSAIGFLYGVYGTIKVYEPEFMSVFMDEKLKHGEIKVVPRSQTFVDDASAFDEVTALLLMDSIEAIKSNKKTYQEVMKKCGAY
jgi:hypothetical protein